MSGRYNTGDDDNLAQQVAELKKRVADLESGNRIGSTAIDQGNLVVSSGASINVLRPTDDGIIARIGDLQDLGIWGISVHNPNPVFPVTNPMFSVGASDVDGIFPAGQINMLDSRGNFIFSLGFPFGIDDPMMAHNFIPTANISTPSLSTTSATFAGLWTVYGYTMHPYINVSYVIQNDVGTTSEVRLRDAVNSNPTTDPTSWGSGAYSFGTIYYEHKSPFTPGGEPFAGMLFQTDLEVRRVSGAGTVRVQVIAATGG